MFYVDLHSIEQTLVTVYTSTKKRKLPHPLLANTEQKKKFFIKDFFSKCDQICSKQQIWSHLLKKFLMQKFIFCAV